MQAISIVKEAGTRKNSGIPKRYGMPVTGGRAEAWAAEPEADRGPAMQF